LIICIRSLPVSHNSVGVRLTSDGFLFKLWQAHSSETVALQHRCRQTTCLDVDYLQAMAKRYQNRIELLQGTLDMLILQTLRWGSQHGYGIAAAIRAGSQEVLQVETGSLYPALHRLEKQGWVKSEWKQTENNQRAKFYNLTAAGRKHLATEQSRWHQMTGAIAGLMNRGEA